MTASRTPRGLYREGTYESGDTTAWITDGTIGMTIPEATYRLRGYSPAYDALPTKAEYEENGGSSA